MEIGEEFKFHNKYDLKGLIYNLDKLSRSYKEIALLSTRITNLGGRISFSISANTIIILEQIQQNFIQTVLMRYDKFDKAVIFEKNAITFVKNEKIENHAKNLESGRCENEIPKLKENPIRKEYKEIEIEEKKLRIIKLNDLEKIMTHLEKNSIENHFLHGLPRIVDLNATISLIIPSNDAKKKTSAHFHTFEILTIQSSNKKYYDFPRYFKSSPEGFATFMTYREKKKVQKYMQSIADKATDIPKEETLLEKEDFYNLPVPHKSNKFCHICRSQFDNYLEHIKSDSHNNFFASSDYIYAKINQSLSNIREFWKTKANEYDKCKESSCDIKEESSFFEKQNNMGSLILTQSRLDPEIHIKDLTAGENIRKNDSNINMNNAYNDLNSMYPDIISRSTKIYSAENEKNERLIQDESKYEHEEKNNSKKEFLSKKRKSSINRTSKISSKSRTNMILKNKDHPRKMTRSNIVEILKNDGGLNAFVEYHTPLCYKNNKNGKKK